MFIMKNKILRIFGILSILLAGAAPLFSQDKTPVTPYFQFQYFKNSDDLRSLRTTLTYSSDRVEVPLPGMEISFYTGMSAKKLLGTALTNENGVARFDIPADLSLPVNSEGKWEFISDFTGNDTIEPASSELQIRDIELDMALSQADSIKTVSLAAFTAEKNKSVPVAGEAVMVYVPRMFSLLPVGEAMLDENGKATLEFPPDLPGDSSGYLTIIARIEEHPDYGNLERKIVEKWGIPVKITSQVAHRALWTKTPPWWMIITLSILLSGVWGHYLFAIISLILIKRESKKEEKQKKKAEKSIFAQ